MNLKTLRYYSNNLTIIFLSLAIAVSLLVSAVNFFYFKSVLFEKQVSSIGSAFAEQGDFTTTAKELLNTNKDITYARLVDADGVLQQSFGNSDALNTKEIIVKNASGMQVFIGIDKSALKFQYAMPLLFTTLITLLVLSLFVIALKLYYPFQKNSLGRLNEQLIKVTKGDYSAKLEIDSELKDDVDMIKVFDSFNEMVDSLSSNKGFTEPGGTNEIKAVNGNGKVHTNGVTKTDSAIKAQKNGSASLESYNDPIIQEPAKPAGTPINGRQIKIIRDSNNKTVVALVSKISDYKKLTEIYDSSELALLLTDFRKTASAVVSQYGGMVETLVRDELVALFNVSENQDKPELRAVSAGVELLHALAEINKHKVRDEDQQISCKIGIYSSAIPVSKESGTPSNLGLAIDPAKGICDSSSDWKLMLSPEVYSCVKDYVEVIPPQNGLHSNYSVLTVEEGVINL